MKMKHIVWPITQSALAIFSACSLILYFGMYGWDTLIYITNFLEKIGIEIKLVGEAGSLNPGAVIVASLYVLIGILLGWILNRTKLRTFGITFCVSTIFLSYIVYGVISSIIWF